MFEKLNEFMFNMADDITGLANDLPNKYTLPEETKK